jgi:ABC-type lipoprotein release transport system permease subunit
MMDSRTSDILGSDPIEPLADLHRAIRDRAGAAGFTQVMRALLCGVSPLDPVTFLAVPLMLATSTLIASGLPARKAMSVNPMETMRVE